MGTLARSLVSNPFQKEILQGIRRGRDSPSGPRLPVSSLQAASLSGEPLPVALPPCRARSLVSNPFQKGILQGIRRGTDSNPRYRHQYNSLAGSPIQPLSHLSNDNHLVLTEKVGFAFRASTSCLIPPGRLTLWRATSCGSSALVGAFVRFEPHLVLTEKVGFEPTEPLGSTVFKTASFNHSDTSPYRYHSIFRNLFHARINRGYTIQMWYMNVNKRDFPGKIWYNRNRNEK